MSFGMLRRVALIRTTLMMEALSSSVTLVLTRATRRNIPKVGIRHSHRSENHKPYRVMTLSRDDPEKTRQDLFVIAARGAKR
jgi:hypothetical protein